MSCGAGVPPALARGVPPQRELAAKMAAPQRPRWPCHFKLRHWLIDFRVDRGGPDH